MRILLFYFAELGGLGGVDVMMSTLARGFTKAGHATGVVEIAKSYKPRRELADGTPVWGVTVAPRPSAGRPRSWAAFARTTLQFTRVVREFKPDIVNVHFPLSQCLPVMGAHSLPHTWKLIVTLHNSDIRVAPLQEPGLQTWQNRLFSRADAVTAVNQALLDDATLMFPVLKRNGTVVLNGIGPQWVQPLQFSDSQPQYALFVGRLDHVKGADILLKAWKGIHSRFPTLELWLAGDGEERDNLQGLAAELGISRAIKFLGRQNQEELRSLYREAHLVVLPSRREGLPLTLLEAGAAGAICVGSRTAGIPEIIQEGVNGFLADTDSVEALTSALNKALDLRPEARCKMKEAAQSHVLRFFSEERMIADYLELFLSIKKSSSERVRAIASSAAGQRV